MPFLEDNPWILMIAFPFTISLFMFISGKRVPSAVARSRRNTAVTQKHHDLRFSSLEEKSQAMAFANRLRRKRRQAKRNVKRHHLPF